jgi:tetratricopeptide (TPR) repeat protein
MKTLCGRVMLFFLFSVISITGMPQKIEQTEIPATSSSKQAQELYAAGLTAFADVNLDKAIDCFQKAAETEPNYIMPNVSLALYYFHLNDMDRFKTCASKALASTYNLNESEKTIQEALHQLVNNPIANVTEYGLTVVKLNPQSLQAYDILATFQGFEGDWPNQNETYQRMLQLTKNPIPIYNKLAYNYLEQNKVDDALPYFVKYITLAPKNPNAYDSMGDYYLKAEDFRKAHIFYLKAYRLDSIHFKISFLKAKKLESKLNQ